MRDPQTYKGYRLFHDSTDIDRQLTKFSALTGQPVTLVSMIDPDADSHILLPRDQGEPAELLGGGTGLEGGVTWGPNLNIAKNTQKLPRKRLPVLKVTPQRQIRDLHAKPQLLVQL